MILSRLGCAALAALIVVGASTRARADEPSQSCARAYENAQVLRRDAKLLSARDTLRVCAAVECAAVIRQDCIEWLAEVERSLPTVVFEAQNGEQPLSDVTVQIDGVPTVTRLDGRAIPLDPGVHTFRFERPGAAPIDEQVVIAEGQKNRVVGARWQPPRPPEDARTYGAIRDGGRGARSERPIPPSVWGFGTAALVGFAGFAALAVIGNERRHDLATTCSPFCTDQDLASSRRAYAMADASLVAGVVATGAAVVLFLTRPERSVSPPASTALAPRRASPLGL